MRIALVGLAFLTSTGMAPAAMPEGLRIDVQARSDVVGAIARQLVEGYVYEAAGVRIASELRRRATEGRYDRHELPEELALALTNDLHEISHDIHLRVEHSRSRPRSTPSSSTGPERPRSPTGLGRHQMLEGDIGYLEMLHFGGGEDAARALDAALAEISGARALILDLRRNLGGGPFMVRYLSTYLFDEPTHLASRVERGAVRPAERWTFESVPGKRLSTVPVVLLISGTTVSAGESFAFGLRNTGRATLIGERTAGGGHFGDMVELGHGFRMFLPRGKTVHPMTGEGWEAEGLEPDLEVPAEEALDAALDQLRGELAGAPHLPGHPGSE